MVRQARHVGWLVYTSNIFSLLNELDKDPEGHLLVAMKHDTRHDKIHPLHISHSIIIVRESRQHPTQSTLVLIEMALDRERHVYGYSCELGHFWECAEEIFLDICIVLPKLLTLLPAHRDVFVKLSHL